jgi:aspartyl-tRNA(Asn)/glutamyl-tRNA(Gln) amidotransferase subunit A
VQLVEAYLDRITHVEPTIKAWCHLDVSSALEQAEVRRFELRRGYIRGSLHGIPVAIKDIIDVAGLPTRAYSPTRANTQPAQSDAHVVQSLRDAGAIIMGKVHTTEFAYFENIPPTCNPHDINRTPGGSSIGSAAAVASGMVPLALGTQTAGSISRPTAYCGIGGFKPSKSVLSTRGIVPFAPFFDAVGTIGYTLTDAFAGFISICPLSHKSVDLALSPGNIIILEDTLLEAVQAEMHSLLDNSINSWSSHGYKIKNKKSPVSFNDLQKLHTIIIEYELSRYHQSLMHATDDEVSVRLREAIQRGVMISKEEYFDCISRLDNLVNKFWKSFDTNDILIFPATPAPAPVKETTGDPQLIIPLTTLGGAIATMNIGLINNMPVGIQLTARPGYDIALGQWSCQLEAINNH